MRSKITTKASTAILISVLCASIAATSTSANDNGFSEITRAGLTDVWFTQLEVGARSKIVNMQLQINEDKATRYFLIEYDGTVERVSQHDISAFGVPYGIEGAEEYANTRREVILAELAAQRRNVPVTIRPITLPQTTIYVATSSGNVTAIDADTGQQIWKTQVGNAKFLTSGVGAGKNHVALANGSTVFCLSADKGRILWSRKCSSAPSAPPSVSDDSVFVPLINGRLESFFVHDGGGLPRTYVSFGTSVAKPLVTDSTVSWATTDGFYAVAPFRAKSIKFRLDSGSKLAAGGASGVNTLFLNTTDGSIFAIDERTGSVSWEYSTGERLSEIPFVREGFVYTISANNNLYKIDISRGRPAPGWETPLGGVSKFVGIAGDRIYLLNSIGRLVAIDTKTGQRVASLGDSQITLILPNYQTDRLYIGTDSGQLRCFRESANTYPVFHANTGELMIENANKKLKTDDDQKKPAAEAADEDDPFAGDDPFAKSGDSGGDDADEDDPFGGGGSDSGSEEDPFGGGGDDDSGEDPFGGDSDEGGSEEDPFGGGGDSDDGEDPFGGGGDSGGDDEDPFGGI